MARWEMYCSTGARGGYRASNSQSSLGVRLQDFVYSYLIVGIDSCVAFADKTIATENRTDDHGGVRCRNSGRVLMNTRNRNHNVVYDRNVRGLYGPIRERSRVSVRRG